MPKKYTITIESYQELEDLKQDLEARGGGRLCLRSSVATASILYEPVTVGRRDGEL